jgi:hypothetical protein
VIHGEVGAGLAHKGGSALPGVAVTATNSLTGHKYTTTTDVDGAYSMTIPKDGRYIVRAELAAFATVTQEVLLNANSEHGGKPEVTADFGLELASRVEAAASRQEGAGSAQEQALGAGLQSLSPGGSEAGGGLSSGGQSSGAQATDASTNTQDASAALPSLAALGDSGAASADSVAFSGVAGQTNPLGNVSEDEIRDRIQEGVDRARANGQLPAGVDPTNAIVGVLGGIMGGAGGYGGHGRGGGGGGRGSGGFRNFNPAQPHGSFFYEGDFSALDSAQWSPTLTPTAKPAYTKSSFGASLLGSPYIPGLIKPSTKQFAFINFSGRKNTTPEIFNGVVPTLAERAGDFSNFYQVSNGRTATTPTPIYDPRTGAQFTSNGVANVIPANQISPQAQAVLNQYYPAPNLTNSPNGLYNYQTITTAGQNSASLNSRYQRNFGADSGNPFARFGGGRSSSGKPTLRQGLSATFNFSHSASDVRNIFLPLGGASESNGYALTAGYNVSYGHLSDNVSVTWNRSHATQRNYFTNTAVNPAAITGVNSPAQAALSVQPQFYNGLPSLSFTDFTSLSNTTPSDSIGQTISFSDGVRYRRGKHNYRFGIDVRRVHQDSLGGANPLGSYIFTGYNTESPADKNAVANGSTAQATSGTGFADFLLGVPQQTTLQAGLAKIYLREWVGDAYAQDDWRAKSNLTLNYGIRYEYFGPYSEKNGRLVNLTGVSNGTSSVGCVTPYGGTYSVNGGNNNLTCTQGPTTSLMHADHAEYAPRIGFAYNVPRLKQTVLRGGYGLNFNTSQYQTFARALSYQQPFAMTQNNILSTATNSTSCTDVYTPGAPATGFTLASGFGCSGKLYQNTYAVNPNYRIGYVQVYNLGVQRTFAYGIVLNVGYNGSKGSDLDVTLAPNHTPSSVTTPNAVAFTYDNSLGESRFNALVIDARKRLEKGISLAATYTYSHSIDDASSFGGASAVSSVQNSADLAAEESNSSFDQRHKLVGTWIGELPFGPNRAFLNQGGWASHVLDGFDVSGNFTFASGKFYTPQYESTASQIAAGGTYALRPDRVFTQPLQGPATLREFFNNAAFIAPQNGYGTASRYSIAGPGTVSVSLALSRTVQLSGTSSFEARVQASNVFNTVQYSGINTTLSSATFGQVTGAATMRQLLFVARYRF